MKGVYIMDINLENNLEDLQLPETPRITVVKETFGGLVDITDEWYKENGE